MKQYKHFYMIFCTLFMLATSCNYLDVIPDNVPTIDNAFSMRYEAEKYLFTCYSYMPKDGNISADPAMEGGDEIWRINSRGGGMFNIARGYQNANTPYGDTWVQMYQGIRDCNIFLENIGRVVDIPEVEKKQWIAEVKFLKAYYHFYLVRMYGPIPLVKENLPIDASVEKVKVVRDPVDDCFHYIVELVDEATEDLPFTTENMQDESGRINQLIALAFKAKVLVYAASPLFNGNTDQTTLKNSDGTPLFNATYSKEKWDVAAVACRKAIEACEEAALTLYEHASNFQQYGLTDTIQTQLSIRNSVCERWNSEIIWANTQSYSGVQALALPLLDVRYPENFLPRGELSPPLKIVEMFYSENGVPIDEDKTWDYGNRYDLRTAGRGDRLHVREGYTTVNLHFNREPRFYASLGFDGGIWYGQGKYDDKKDLELFYPQTKMGQMNARGSDRSTVTGYFIKKLIHFENVVSQGTNYTVNNYPWPMIRLGDLYLLYAEALNESEGPGQEVYQYLNLVRQRAGLPTVEEAWSNYSNNPQKYTPQNGLRDLIHRERIIELVFEGQRFWDLRRWKESAKVLNTPIKGWNAFEESPVAYYVPVTLFSQKFGLKDYFWPIRDSYIISNRNLVQNIGW